VRKQKSCYAMNIYFMYYIEMNLEINFGKSSLNIAANSNDRLKPLWWFSRNSARWAILYIQSR